MSQKSKDIIKNAAVFYLVMCSGIFFSQELKKQTVVLYYSHDGAKHEHRSHFVFRNDSTIHWEVDGKSINSMPFKRIGISGDDMTVKEYFGLDHLGDLYRLSVTNSKGIEFSLKKVDSNVKDLLMKYGRDGFGGTTYSFEKKK